MISPQSLVRCHHKSTSTQTIAKQFSSSSRIGRHPVGRHSRLPGGHNQYKPASVAMHLLTIMVCVFPEEVTPYANTVALMPSMAAATTLLADLVYTCVRHIVL